MKLGFIGFGNMASAIVRGILDAGIVKKEEITASDASEKARETAAALGIHGTCDNREAAACDTVFLAVKPQFYQTVIAEIAPTVTKETLIITIAPGWTLEKLGSTFGKPVKLIRTMPNTPAMVGEGMTALCCGESVSAADQAYACSLLESFGRCAVIPERMMEAVIVASGSSPAFVYMFIEALADSAVREGMPRDMAYRFAAQSVLGSAKMVLETGLHPGALKDMVCSPAGTTIEAVAALEAGGFRSAILQAAKVCADKARAL